MELLHAELQKLADEIKARNVARLQPAKQRAMQQKRAPYVVTPSAYGAACMRCGGTSSGRDARGGFVGLCCCKGVL